MPSCAGSYDTNTLVKAAQGKAKNNEKNSILHLPAKERHIRSSLKDISPITFLSDYYLIYNEGFLNRHVNPDTGYVSCENVSLGICGHERPRLESDQSLHYPLTKSLNTTKC